MKLYEALYCDCTHESSFATISIHRTREGAEKAVQDDKDKMKAEHEKSKKDIEDAGLEFDDYEWNIDKEWDIQETELLD